MATKKVKRTVRRITKKATPKTNTSVDFNKSIDKFRSTAVNVNTQMVEAASELVEDVRVKGIELRDAAANRVKDAIENIDVEKGAKRIRKTAKNVNEFAMDTTEELIEGAVKNSEQWQTIGAKALKGGLKLAAKQQDIMFNTLETLKGQMMTSGKRFRKLLK